MKKLILLAFASLLLSCSNDSNNSSSNNNGNSFTNNMDYEFTIKINGEVHKVKGNTTNGIPYGNAYSIVNQINNTCYAMNIGGSVFASLVINDVTATNYVSGQNLTCQIELPNLLLGTNQATVKFIAAGYFQTLASNLGSPVISPYLLFQTTSGEQNDPLELVINITDLGKTSTNPISTPYNFGQTLKGNYSGTVYLLNSNRSKYTIPVQLSIDFKVLRRY